MVGAGESHEHRAANWTVLPVDEHAHVARRLEQQCARDLLLEEGRTSGEEQEVDVLLPGRQPDSVLAGSRGPEGRRSGCNTTRQQLRASLVEERSRPTEVVVVGDDRGDDQLTRGASRQRPGNTQQTVRAVSAERDDDDRPRGRRQRSKPERRIVSKDRALDFLEHRARLEPELVDEALPRSPVGVERLGLASRAVEGEHQVRHGPLAEGVLGDEGLELPDELGVAAKRELGLEPALQGEKTELFEAAHIRTKQGLVGDVRKCSASPERKRLAQLLGSLSGAAVSERAAAFLDEPLEATQVDQLGIDNQCVSAWPRRNRVSAERPSEAGDVTLDHVGRSRRRLSTPKHVGQTIARDHLVRPRNKNRKKSATPGTPQGDLAVSIPDLERSENSVVHSRRRYTAHQPITSGSPDVRALLGG